MSLPAPSDVARAGVERGEMAWHPDPWRRHEMRFHDGRQWTEHVADRGLCSLDSTPVADLPRSRPTPAVDHPPERPSGPHVVPDDRSPGALDGSLLLLGAPDATGHRPLHDPDDRPVGVVAAPRPGGPARVLAAVGIPAPSRPTTYVVRDASGAERLRVSRPARRIAPEVDVAGPDVRPARVVARAVRQGLDADLRRDGDVLGRLERTGPGAHDLRVVDPDGRTLARTASVWDVPGRRRHLPPGTVLIDRRTPDGLADDPGRAVLVLGALLAVDLLLPGSG